MTAAESPRKGEMEAVRPVRRRTGLLAGVALILVVVVILAYGASAGWFGGSGPAGSTVTLQGAGSTFVFPLMSLWASQYEAAAGVQVNYQGIGSGGGINGIMNKNLDFGATDAPLNASQHASYPNLLTIPESIGAVTFAYNLPNVPAHINVTGPIVAGIYLGAITMWNNASLQAVNPGVALPNAAILVVHRAESSGTTYAWTDYLSKVSPQWAAGPGKGKSVNWPTGIGAQGNPGVAAVVQGQKYACGYVELAFALQNSMQYAKVLNQEGSYVLPTLNSTAAAASSIAGSLPAGNGDWSSVSITNAPGADSYPISTFTYLLVYKELNVDLPGQMTQARAQALATFLWWVDHDGQSAAAGLSYVPLPHEIATTLNEATLHSITYNGVALLA